MAGQSETLTIVNHSWTPIGWAFTSCLLGVSLVGWLHWFNAELSPKRYWRGPTESQEVGEGGGYIIPNAALSVWGAGGGGGGGGGDSSVVRAPDS